LGFALGKSGEYTGTPEQVGMLLSGITTAYTLGVKPRPGAPVWGGSGDGYIMFNTGTIQNTAGAIKKILGYCIGCEEIDSNGDCTGNKILMYFNPDHSYAKVSTAYGYQSGSWDKCSQQW